MTTPTTDYFSQIAVNIEQAEAIVKHAIEKGLTPMLWGSYGVGKTSFIRKIGQEMGFDSTIVLNPSQDDILSYLVPWLSDDQQEGKVANFAITNRLPREGNHLIFVDEINTAPVSLQPTLYSLILEHRINEFTLPKGCRTIAAGNRDFDQGATNPMAAPLKDRMHPHLNIITSADVWEKWAMNNDIHPSVISFVKAYPFVLDESNHDDPCGGCTPRSLEALSSLVDGLPPSCSIDAVVNGTVGCGTGAKFMAHWQDYINQISFEEIVSNPDKAPVPPKIGQLYSLMYSCAYNLAHRAQKNDGDMFKNVIKYLSRFGKSYAVLGVHAARKKNERIFSSGGSLQKALVDFITEHQDIIV